VSTRQLRAKLILGGPSNAANDNESDWTSKFWAPRFARDLSTEEVRQIKENVVGFFAILTEWASTEKLVAGNDNRGTHMVLDER
jgi:hypothetical protein